MPSEPGPDREQRLHPSTLLFRLARHARNLLVPGLLVLWLARGERWELWLMAIFVPSTVYEILRYVSLRYRFTDDQIILRQGIVFRNERHIPLARIQNIDIVQNPLQRLVRVADVRLETASGAEPEAVLQVLSINALEQMRARVFAGRAPPGSAAAFPGAGATAADADSPRPLLHLSRRELIKLGLISNRGMALVAIAGGVAWEFDLLEKVSWLDWVGQFEDETDVGRLALAAAGLVFAGALGIVVLSIAWTLVRWHGYRLERVGDDVRMSCGLLTRRSATIPRRRIQFLSIHESVPHRWFGRVTVRAETAGGGEESESLIGRSTLAPLVPKERVAPLLADLLPALDLRTVDWQPLTPRGRRRLLRRELLIAALAALGGLALVYPWGGLVLLALLPLAWWHASAAAGYLCYARTPGGVAFRSGVWTRKTSVTFFDKIQVVSLHESPLDRRCGMASLQVDTAGAGPAGHRIRIPYLQMQVGRDLQDDLSDMAQRSAFRW